MTCSPEIPAAAPVRFGVIGAGWFASRRHIPDIAKHPGAVVAALCRRDTSSLVRVRDQVAPGAALYSDWRQMLAEANLDVVVVATPHHLHYEQVLAALNQGVNVVAEKPLTVRAEDALHLVRVAKEHNLLLSVALNPPHWAHCRRMREVIRDGMIGEVEAVSLFWTGNAEYVFADGPKPENLPGVVAPTMFRADPAQCGGGYLMDGGPHLISEALWVTGLRPVSVTCRMDRLPSDRRAALIIELENGAVATISTVGNSRSGGRRVSNRFAGTDGTIEVEHFNFHTRIESRKGTEEFTEAELPPAPGPVANMIEALRGKAPLASDGTHGATVVQVLEAAYQSAREGRTIAIPPAE